MCWRSGRWRSAGVIGRRRWRRCGMADPLLSVIIPLWNGREFIDDCLSSLLASSAELGGETEILVVDNGSADGSAAHVA
ncbi:MAG: glycosyltransferase, partial [Caldilineaceae bacterium]|nr:glycosyltransferase [Caldilineaceae bacterium]